MPKLIPDPELRELQRDPRTKIYYVRKRAKSKEPLLKSTGTRDRTRARKIALDVLARYLADTPIVATSPIFRDIAEKVLALKANKSQATRDLATNRIRLHLMPYFGYMQISKITENTWEEYITKVQTESDRTLADDAKLMMSVMKYAFNERYLERKVRIRNPDRPNEEGRAYTEEEIYTLLQNSSTEEMRLQILIGWSMGLRHGEIAALRWAWIHFDTNRIQLPPEVTKTRRGRSVPLNDEVRRELIERRRTLEGPCVFPSQNDPSKPIPDFDSQWQRTWTRSGLDGVFHWLRHTCISNMAASGIPESTIKKIVGCSDRTMRKVYIHLRDDLADRAVNLGTQREIDS